VLASSLVRTLLHGPDQQRQSLSRFLPELFLLGIGIA